MDEQYGKPRGNLRRASLTTHGVISTLTPLVTSRIMPKTTAVSRAFLLGSTRHFWTLTSVALPTSGTKTVARKDERLGFMWYEGPMKITGIILSMLLSLPPAYVDRDEPDHDTRMQTIAEAIAHASDRATCSHAYDDSRCQPIWTGDETELAALLVTKGWWESRFAKNVHEGRCGPQECDATRLRNGTIVHRARSPWQVQRTSYSESLWDDIEGSDFESTRNAAWVATKILSDGKQRCRSNFGALSWYAVQKCSSRMAKNRFFTFEKLTGKR